MKITRHVCPLNCYDTCSILAHVDNDRLIKVSGDPLQSYTLGTLCSKGYSLTEHTYHPDRILYPLRQSSRGSENWKRITWEEALQEISGKILEIYQKDSNLLPLALLDGKANTGVLARSLSHMLSSISPITQIENPHSGGAVLDAQLLDFGGYSQKDPEDMKKADLIVLWGVNPASTAIHQMRILQQARNRGTKVILIDVFPSVTADKVDKAIFVKPGGDGALALAILRELMLKSSLNYHFLFRESEGWENLRDWLLETDPEQMRNVAGISGEVITYLANEIRRCSTTVFWIGKGLQKYTNSGQNIRAIHALAVAGGLMKDCGGGIYTSHSVDFLFNDIWGSDLINNRKMNFSSFMLHHKALDPGIRMLWVTQSNPLVQGTELQAFRKMMSSLDLIVTTEHFLTPTARYSDIVLPAATLFEMEDIIAGGWHQWLGLNEQAITPLGEVRSELEIAQALSRVLNKAFPGVCPFPADRAISDWLRLAVPPQLCRQLGIDTYKELKNGPQKIPLKKLADNSQLQRKYRFVVPEAMELGCPEIPSIIAPVSPPESYPYRLICVRQADRLNSQFGNLSWLLEGQVRDEIILNKELAGLKKIVSGDQVSVYNQWGEITLKAKVSQEFPDNIVVCSARQDLNVKSINNLIGGRETDMGKATNGVFDMAFHETFVNIVRS
ncbi:anaerobic dehydrogenase, typically selenocysteine-containing [Desulfosporosinus orientis DSM 765]|uniref:Anaerobic dehydrogenase, typically selenocysteine-containing n=1 Tax=Desulfosporosinus orientis (strain ATCC 19365 / DSM 765 / NCIMB 8382 / VKM B-1628 / Singapore I) TaxID=768706 RepID=G7W6I5_DESOD|nr:anaerobic dehydrogenase, typically selenocysteine-containing [Desulfosporosinus orientis DSM 765]